MIIFHDNKITKQSKLKMIIITVTVTVIVITVKPHLTVIEHLVTVALSSRLQTSLKCMYFMTSLIDHLINVAI